MSSTTSSNNTASTTPFITFIPSGVAPILVDVTHKVSGLEENPNFPAFQDALAVREEVFVKEQGVPLQNELDEDDHRSFHWVVYASVAAVCTPAHRQHNHHHPGHTGGSSTARIPVGTIRLVPPPHSPHGQITPPTHYHHPDLQPPSAHEEGNYIKLGRLATISAFRGLGIGKLLVETALTWAAAHPDEIMGDTKPNKRLSVSGTSIAEQMRKAAGAKREGGDTATTTVVRGGDLGALLATAKGWEGMVLVHAQKEVQLMWEKLGFIHDRSMGEWDEEGIVHVSLFLPLFFFFPTLPLS